MLVEHTATEPLSWLSVQFEQRIQNFVGTIESQPISVGYTIVQNDRFLSRTFLAMRKRSWSERDGLYASLATGKKR